MLPTLFSCVVIYCADAFLLPSSFTIRAVTHTQESGVEDQEKEKLMTEHEVTLMKPMGIILEEDEDNPALGVVVRRIDPHGHAAVACRFDPEGVDICVRDTLVEVNGRDITRKTLEEIIAIIRDGPDRVELRLRRPYDAVIVRWANGISVAAQPGDSVGYIAQHEALVKISYSCTSGGCGSCEQSIIDEDGNVSVCANCFLFPIPHLLLNTAS